MFLGALDPVNLQSNFVLRAELVLYFVFNFFSLYIFSKSILKSTVSNKILLIISLIFNIILLNTIPDIFEYLYWYPSVTAYQLGLSMYLLFIANMFFRSAERIGQKTYFVLNTLIIVFSIGLLELFIVPFLFASSVNIFFKWKNNKLIKAEISILIIGLISAIILLIAPGNYVRMRVEKVSDFISGTFLALKSLIYLLGYIFQNPIFVFGSILFVGISNTWLIKNAFLQIDLPKLNPIILLILTLGFTFVFLFPASFALGKLPPGRVFNIAAFVFIVLWLYNIYNFQKYFGSKYNFQLPKFFQKTIAVLMFMFVFSGIYVINPYEFSQKKDGSYLLTGNILNAYNTWIYQAKGFEKDMLKQHQEFVKAEEQGKRTLVVKPLNHHPEMLLFADINELGEPGTWIFNWEAKYYGLDSIYIATPDNNNIKSIKKENNPKHLHK